MPDEALAPPASRRRQAEEARLGLALAAPIVIVMGALVFGPVLLTLWDSLHRIDPLKAGTPFIGLQHYADLMTDPNVRAAWLNTLAYVVFAVVVETAGGLAAALLLNAVKRGRRWLLAATVLPWALPPVINAIVWLWIYNPSYGLLNGVLKASGVITENHVWFNNRATALMLIGLVHVCG